MQQCVYITTPQEINASSVTRGERKSSYYLATGGANAIRLSFYLFPIWFGLGSEEINFRNAEMSVSY